MSEPWEDLRVECAWTVKDLTTGRSVGAFGDEAMPILSVVKVPLVLCLYRLAERGELDLTQRLRLTPDGRSQGNTGISAMHDTVEISLRDAAYLAITISDNAAADAIYDTVRNERLAAELADIGMPELCVQEPLRDMYDRIDALGTADGPTANTATPHVLIRLLEAIWTDRAASPESCATLRDLMTRQAWQDRIGSGFPASNITVAAKSGTVLGLRHEIGVVTYPGNRQYAAAYLTSSLTDRPDHRVDAAIGQHALSSIRRLRVG